ncbi:PREDICTED: protein DDC8 homolog [Elephantulus edwardii]|uniref:protein DDC8 homolog n=1 Tax=Elephantulus edwardii TaxID=28737 RepID=UPI0003F0EE04|nr:PREDICTED: protein DDC8 homolog [Elephantulus edwardii]
MKRGLERADWPGRCPEEEVLPSRRQPCLQPGRERGDVAEGWRPDLQSWKRLQLQRLAKELSSAWPVVRRQHRGLGWLYLLHLLGMAGGCTEDSQLDLQDPTLRAATRPQRTREKCRLVSREETHREGLSRRLPWSSKPPKKAAGSGKRPTTGAAGVTRSAPSPPKKRKGRQGSSGTTTRGGQPQGPRPGRAAEVDKLRVLSDSTQRGEEREWFRDRRRQMDTGEALVMVSPKHRHPDAWPEDGGKGLQRLWPSLRSRAVSTPPPDKLGDVMRWQREVAAAFQELFNNHQKLRDHLRIHLELRSREGPGPSCARGRRTIEEPRSEAQCETTGERALARKHSYPVEAHHTPSRTELKRLLDRIETQKYCRLGKCLFEEKSSVSNTRPESPDRASFSKASVSVEESLLSEARQEPPKTAMTGGTPPHQRHLREQARGRGLVEPKRLLAWDMEWRRQKQPEHPKMNLEAPLSTQLEEEKRPQRPAQSQPSSLQVQGQEGSQRPSTSSLSAISILDSNRHSPILQDRRQQILEQKKMHQQFLQEARKRLQEFQTLC